MSTITDMSLTNIIANGETQIVEFKKSLGEQKEGLIALTSMLNTDLGEGTVIFGVSNDGIICGIEPGNIDTAQKSLLAHVQVHIRPPIMPNILVLTVACKNIITISAKRFRTVPFHEYNGTLYIREGSTNKKLDIDGTMQLKVRRNRDTHNGPWKCDTCGGIVVFLIGVVVTSDGAFRSYTCDCGGEYWPV